MTSLAAIDALLADWAVDARVVPSAYGLRVSGSTARTYADPGEATGAAHDLLAQVLRLGYGLQGALVGSECVAPGEWRGVLAEVFIGLGAGAAAA